MATQGLRRAVSLPDRDGRSSAKGEIDAVLWARDAAVDVIAPRSRLPLWGGEGGAGVLRLDDEGAAGVGPACGPKKKLRSPQRPVIMFFPVLNSLRDNMHNMHNNNNNNMCMCMSHVHVHVHGHVSGAVSD